MHELDCPRCGRRPLDEFVVRRRAPDRRRRRSPTRTARDFDEVWIFDNPDGLDDRALVPRGRLPALADRPPRHRRSIAWSRSDDVRRLRRPAARDPGPRPGAVRCRRRRRAAGRRRASSARVAGVRRDRPRRRRGRASPAASSTCCVAPASRSSCSTASSRTRATAAIERGSERAPRVRRGSAGDARRRRRARRRVGDGLGQGDRPPRAQSACCHVTWLPR